MPFVIYAGGTGLGRENAQKGRIGARCQELEHYWHLTPLLPVTLHKL
jgi:hypothetical protein